MLIANSVAKVADQVFSLPAGDLTAGLAWLGAVCYTLQIYFDFSGYSDMAIGLARMLRVPLSGEFQLSLHLPINTGILEKMAHFIVHLVQGLSLYPIGWKPTELHKNLYEFTHCISFVRSVAWGKLEFCNLGVVPWPIFGDRADISGTRARRVAAAIQAHLHSVSRCGGLGHFPNRVHDSHRFLPIGHGRVCPWSRSET